MTIPERARRLLEDECSFVLDVEPSGLSMLAESEALRLVAGDGMGGCFFEWLTEPVDGVPPVVYLTQYGETSRFADSFEGAISIVSAFPENWGDLLVAANKGGELFGQVLERTQHGVDSATVRVTLELTSLLSLNLQNIAERMLVAVQRQPAFAPLLETEDGPTPPCHFRDRPYPR